MCASGVRARRWSKVPSMWGATISTLATRTLTRRHAASAPQGIGDVLDDVRAEDDVVVLAASAPRGGCRRGCAARRCARPRARSRRSDRARARRSWSPTARRRRSRASDTAAECPRRRRARSDRRSQGPGGSCRCRRRRRRAISASGRRWHGSRSSRSFPARPISLLLGMRIEELWGIARISHSAREIDDARPPRPHHRVHGEQRQPGARSRAPARSRSGRGSAAAA